MAGVRELYITNVRTSSPDEPRLPFGDCCSGICVFAVHWLIANGVSRTSMLHVGCFGQMMV